MKRPRRTREQTREQILDAAEELFAARSPSMVSVRDVAAKVGVTHALVHQYVGTKDDLYHAVLQRAVPSRQKIVTQVPDYRSVMPILFNDVLERRLHSLMQIRSAMDGVPYGSLERPIPTGAMLNALAQRAKEAGTVRQMQDEAMDPRIVSAGVSAMAFGWVACGEWLDQIYELGDEDPEWVRSELVRLAASVIELVFPAAACADAGDGVADSPAVDPR